MKRAYHTAMSQFVGGSVTTLVLVTIMVAVDPIKSKEGESVALVNFAWWATSVLAGVVLWGLVALYEYHSLKALDKD